MSRYQINAADLGYAAEFRDQPLGYHSPGLQRILNAMRGGPKAGKYVLVMHMNDPAPGLGGAEAEIIRSDMTFFGAPNGGAVFSTGSIAWAGSLSHNNYDNDVARITANVLRRFVDGTPF